MLGKIIAPLGAATLFCVITTLILGLNLKKNRKVILPWHRGMAFTTVVLALTHAAVVFFH